jgi:hypothetical protein
VQPVARLLLDVGRTRQLLLRFLQRSDLLLLTRDAAGQRRNLRPLAKQLTRGCGQRKGERGDDHCEHRRTPSERRLAVARHLTVDVGFDVNVNGRNGSTVVCGRTAAAQRQPTTNRGNAAAPA